jgi:hypothetical protein
VRPPEYLGHRTGAFDWGGTVPEQCRNVPIRLQHELRITIILGSSKPHRTGGISAPPEPERNRNCSGPSELSAAFYGLLSYGPNPAPGLPLAKLQRRLGVILAALKGLLLYQEGSSLMSSLPPAITPTNRS